MSYPRILVPVDGSSLSNDIVEHAVKLAKAFDSQVTVMTVVSVDPMVGVDFYKVAPSITEHVLETESKAGNYLEEMNRHFIENGINTSTKIIHGEATVTGILNVADEINADLIIMGSHGRSGLKKLMLGSVAQKVLSESSIPVFIVKQP